MEQNDIIKKLPYWGLQIQQYTIDSIQDLLNLRTRVAREKDSETRDNYPEYIKNGSVKSAKEFLEK